MRAPPSTRTLAAAAAVAITLGCAGGTEPTVAAARVSAGADSGTTHPSTAYVIRGVVISDDGAAPDTLAPIAGVTLHVALRATSQGADSAGAGNALVPVGTVVSDAHGAFELPNVAYGFYVLDAVPPAGSPYLAGRAYSESLRAASTDRAYVYLQRAR